MAGRWWDTFSVCQSATDGRCKWCRELFWGAEYEQWISTDARTWKPSTWRRGKQPNWKLRGCSGCKGLSIQHYQKHQLYSLDTHFFQIIESRSRDLCAFLCYLFSGDLLVLAKIINKAFYESCYSFRNVKMCFLAPVSRDKHEGSKKFSLVLCQKNLDEGETLIYILSFCCTGKHSPPSVSSHLHRCFRLEKNSMWWFWSTNKNRDTEWQWKSCHMFSADKQKGTLGQCRILSFTCSTRSDKIFLLLLFLIYFN